MSKSLGKRLNTLVKKNDMFGIPVGLTYKGDTQIKSTVGGIATLLSRALIGAYLAFEVYKVL